MPQFFGELKPDDRDRRIDELWAALVHQDRLPLPKGLIDTQTEGTRIVVGDDPVVFRVAIKITPQLQIDRAINVGLPGGKNFAFDARTARLRGVWMGDFINAAPAWNGRGGNPVTLLADALYVPPDHFPLRVGDVTAEPTVRFLGYSLVERHPVFRYAVDGVEVQERIEVTDDDVVRQFMIAKTSRPLFFVDDKDRAYTSSTGKLKDGVMKVDAGTNVKVQVRRSLPLERVEVKSLKWIAAGDAEPPKSKNGATANVTFENKSKRRVKVYWISYGGERKLYAQLAPGATHRQNTYVNNTWLIADESDQPLGHFIVGEQASRAVIPE